MLLSLNRNETRLWTDKKRTRINPQNLRSHEKFSFFSFKTYFCFIDCCQEKLLHAKIQTHTTRSNTYIITHAHKYIQCKHKLTFCRQSSRWTLVIEAIHKLTHTQAREFSRLFVIVRTNFITPEQCLILRK